MKKLIITFLILAVWSNVNAQDFPKYLTMNFSEIVDVCPCLIGSRNNKGFTRITKKVDHKVASVNFKTAGKNPDDLPYVYWEKYWKDMTLRDPERYPKMKPRKKPILDGWSDIDNETHTVMGDFHGTPIKITYLLKPAPAEKTYTVEHITISSEEDVSSSAACKQFTEERNLMYANFHHYKSGKMTAGAEKDPVIQAMQQKGYEFRIKRAFWKEKDGASYPTGRSGKIHGLSHFLNDDHGDGHMVALVHSPYSNESFEVEWCIYDSFFLRKQSPTFTKYPYTEPKFYKNSHSIIVNKETKNPYFYPKFTSDLPSSRQYFNIYIFFKAGKYPNALSDKALIDEMKARFEGKVKPKPTVHTTYKTQEAKKKRIAELAVHITGHLKTAAKFMLEEATSNLPKFEAGKAKGSAEFYLKELEYAKKKLLEMKALDNYVPCISNINYTKVGDHIDTAYRALQRVRDQFMRVRTKEDLGKAYVQSAKPEYFPKYLQYTGLSSRSFATERGKLLEQMKNCD